MPVDFLANAKPVKVEDDFLANATPVSAPATNRPAGLPAGLDLPQLAAHPAVNMRGGAGNLETIPSSLSEPGLTGAIKTGVHNFGARVANNGIALLKPLAHPINSMLANPGFSDPSDMGGPIQTILRTPDKGVGIANALGDTATALLTARGLQGAAEGASALAPKIVPSIGRSGVMLQDAGAALLNSKFTPTMKEVIRGSNPGKGMLEAGIGPTMTKGNLAAKVNGAEQALGSRISGSVARADQNALAPPILSMDIAPAIRGPITEALGTLNGPFGTASTLPYETMSAKLGNAAPGASTPIYGPNAPAEIAPSDLWKTIQNLDKNTRFNTDPEVESVNETRRDIRHGLRPLLEATDPTIKPLSNTYGNLLSAGDAIARTQGGFSVPKGISSLLDSTIKGTLPVTAGARGLFKVGGGLKSFATNAPEWMGGSGGAPATIGYQPRAQAMVRPQGRLASGVIANPGGADYSTGGFPDRPNVVTPEAPSLFRLPTSASAGEAQPMLGIKAESHPGLAEDFSRTRIVPSRGELNRMGPSVLAPQTKGLNLPAGSQLLRLPQSVEAGQAQPMIGIRNDYPELATPFAKERVPATLFKKPTAISNGMFTVGEDGQLIPERLGLPSPSKLTRKK